MLSVVLAGLKQALNRGTLLLEFCNLALRLPAFRTFKNIKLLFALKWQHTSNQHWHVANYADWAGHDRGTLSCIFQHNGHLPSLPLKHPQNQSRKAILILDLNWIQTISIAALVLAAASVK